LRDRDDTVQYAVVRGPDRKFCSIVLTSSSQVYLCEETLRLRNEPLRKKQTTCI